LRNIPEFFVNTKTGNFICRKNALKEIVNNSNEDHYFILIKFINKGLISQIKLKNFQYQLNIILLKLADKFYHEIRLVDSQKIEVSCA